MEFIQVKKYIFKKNGFEGVLYEAPNNDDRVLIVVQGLKGLELPQKYAKLFIRIFLFSWQHIVVDRENT